MRKAVRCDSGASCSLSSQHLQAIAPCRCGPATCCPMTTHCCIAFTLPIMLVAQKGAPLVVRTRTRLAGQAAYKAVLGINLGLCASGAPRVIAQLLMHR